jgi:hypothetical protein
MFSGVCGLVRKMRLSPRRKSYVCKLLPTDVVTWKVVLPRDTEVNGTGVGETRPTVCKLSAVVNYHMEVLIDSL